MTTPHLLVIGAGLAGAKAALAARHEGFDGRITLIGDEAELPYERPSLSKGVLRGEDPETTRVTDATDYDTNQITLLTGTNVIAVDRRARTALLADDTTLAYSAAVIATGARPNRLTAPGADLAGVHYLRTLDDAKRLTTALGSAGRVAVIGAGWIGSEVAASARQIGRDVTLIDPSPTPLHRVLGPQLGEVFRRLHAENGVDLRLGSSVTSLIGNHTVEALELDDGTRVDTDVVVVGIGVTPQTSLAAAAGIGIDNGILVDHHLRTNDPTIYAAGDVANAWHPHFHRRIRVEHWANALNQGDTAGRNAVGATVAYDRLPYFYSDQYDLGLEYVGHHDVGDEVSIAGDIEQRTFTAYWQQPDATVTAAMAVNTWDVIDELKDAVTTGRLPARDSDSISSIY